MKEVAISVDANLVLGLLYRTEDVAEVSEVHGLCMFTICKHRSISHSADLAITDVTRPALSQAATATLAPHSDVACTCNLLSRNCFGPT
jgi:hypothetical protein